ncbi:uncharacterized protein LOC121410043 [Lytechinus variegatus]|uniref:uncharacterized protein LOC121410043 n=1 Tax=Lytechinus variegatus TaxID=7654 RepID=UPI001BB2A974|nr:uncharacterized protein LOC121410043 [Lytechinus variegatus]
MARLVLPVLLLIFTLLSCIYGAPVLHQAPPQKIDTLPSHITKGDVMLLKEKLEELEADLDQLKPKVPSETTGNEEEEDDVEAVDDTNDEAVETRPDISASIQNQPQPNQHNGPAEEEVESEPVVEQTQQVEEEGFVGEEGSQEEVGGEWEEEEAVHEGILPYPQDDDIYLRKLIVQALTVLYRKDAERIERMLQKYEKQLLDDDVFSENIVPAPQDLQPNPGQKMEASAIGVQPFTNEELHQQEILDAMAAKKRQDIDTAEHTLLVDMQTFEGEGITLDDLLKDLAEKKNNQQSQQLPMGPRNVDIEEEGEAMFGEYKEEPEVNNDGAIDEDPALSLQELLNTDNEGVVDIGHEYDESEENADDLLMELISNLNASLKKLKEQKAELPK